MTDHRIVESDSLHDGTFVSRCSCGWSSPEPVSVLLVHAEWEQHFLDETRES